MLIYETDYGPVRVSEREAWFLSHHGKLISPYLQSKADSIHRACVNVAFFKLHGRSLPSKIEAR